MMSTLLVWREQLQKLYAKYSVYFMKVLQFILGLAVFGLINNNLGYMKSISSMGYTVILSAVCAFLPLVVTTLAATILIIVHFYALSAPIAVVTAIIFLLMYIFYFRFTPKKSWLVLLTPIAFALKVPFVIPVAFGLLGTPISVVPAAFGTIAYYITHYVKLSSSVYKGGDAKGMAEDILSFSKQALTSKEMWTMVAAISLSFLVVYFIRKKSVDHSWKIASVAGAVVAVVIGTAGNVGLDIHLSYVSMVISGVIGVLIGLVLEFLFFSVDYARTEYVQFEDNEYYYYVKAVPKIGVSAPEVSVKHINERKNQSETEVIPDFSGLDTKTEESEKDVQSKETVVMNSDDIKHAFNLDSAKAEEPERRRPVAAARDKVRTVDSARMTDEILLTRSLTKELGLFHLEKENEEQ